MGVTYIPISALSAPSRRDSQGPAGGALTNAVNKLADAVQVPPSQAQLDELAYELQEVAGGEVVTVFEQRRSRSGPMLDVFTADLRSSVREGDSVVWQRVMID